MKLKEARVSFNKPSKSWVIRYWSETDKEWNEDSWYPVKDIDEKSELGWVSEELLCRFYELQHLGYKIVFIQ